MSIASPPKTTVTRDQYLEQELTSEIRHEYRNGVIVPMTGGTPNHNDISGNLYLLLKTTLRQKAFRVFHLDQRLWIPAANLYTYPDVMVTPKPLELQTGRKDTVINPCLIAEVLSQSTQNYDRGDKFLAYRTIPTVQEYLLVDQYKIHVEHHRKTGDRQWLMTEYSELSGTLTLVTLDLDLTLADLYDGVELEPR